MRPFAALVYALIALSPLGCGNSGSSTVTGRPAATSRATVTVRWPDPGRVVPAATTSLQIDIMNGATFISRQLLMRPAAGGTTTVAFDSLPVGTFSLTATAYPQPDGTGTPLAAATAPLILQAGQTTNFSLTLASAIDHLELSAPVTQLVSGSALSLSVNARDASGAYVLLTPGKLAWTSSQSNIASVDSIGTVSAGLAGTTVISVVDTELNKSAQISIQVLVGVTVQPGASTLTLGNTLTLTAAVIGTANTGVTWSVQEANGGSVSNTGVYTAPNRGGTFHVVAKSVVDPTRSATATVTVQAGTASGIIQ